MNKLHTYLLLGSSFLLFACDKGVSQSKELKKEADTKVTALHQQRDFVEKSKGMDALSLPEQEVLLTSKKNESPLPNNTFAPSEIDSILEKLAAERKVSSNLETEKIALLKDRDEVIANLEALRETSDQLKINLEEKELDIKTLRDRELHSAERVHTLEKKNQEKTKMHEEELLEKVTLKGELTILQAEIDSLKSKQLVSISTQTDGTELFKDHTSPPSKDESLQLESSLKNRINVLESEKRQTEDNCIKIGQELSEVKAKAQETYHALLTEKEQLTTDLKAKDMELAEAVELLQNSKDEISNLQTDLHERKLTIEAKEEEAKTLQSRESQLAKDLLALQQRFDSSELRLSTVLAEKDEIEGRLSFTTNHMEEELFAAQAEKKKLEEQMNNDEFEIHQKLVASHKTYNDHLLQVRKALSTKGPAFASSNYPHVTLLQTAIDKAGAIHKTSKTKEISTLENLNNLRVAALVYIDVLEQYKALGKNEEGSPQKCVMEVGEDIKAELESLEKEAKKEAHKTETELTYLENTMYLKKSSLKSLERQYDFVEHFLNATFLNHTQFTVDLGNPKYGIFNPWKFKVSLSSQDNVRNAIRKLFTEENLSSKTINELAEEAMNSIKGYILLKYSDNDFFTLEEVMKEATNSGESEVFRLFWPSNHRVLEVSKLLYSKAIDQLGNVVRDILASDKILLFFLKDAQITAEGRQSTSLSETNVVRTLFSASVRSTPSDLTAERGTATTAAMRQGETGSVDLRESFGQKFDLKLPLHVRVVGDTNLKETSNTLGSVFYKAENALFGVSQAYANQGNAFDVNGKQLETSAVSTFTLGKAFAEFQSGIVSADKVSGSTWSGSRQAMFVGYDMAGGISPFVQVSARQLNQENGVKHAENGAYLGTTVDATKTNAFFNTTSLITVKSGLVSDKASLGSRSRTDSLMDHSVHMEQGFGSEGVSFNTSVGLSTKQKTNLKVSVGFSQ